MRYIKKNLLTSPIFFCFAIFALDVGQILFALRSFPDRFKGLASQEAITILPFIFRHLLGMAALYAIFSFTLVYLLKLFLVKIKWPVFSLVGIYIISYTIVSAPFLYVGTGAAANLISANFLNFAPSIIYASAISLLAYLSLSLYQSGSQRRKTQYNNIVR
jgi:hypothetical protein